MKYLICYTNIYKRLYLRCNPRKDFREISQIDLKYSAPILYNEKDINYMLNVLGNNWLSYEYFALEVDGDNPSNETLKQIINDYISLREIIE